MPPIPLPAHPASRWQLRGTMRRHTNGYCVPCSCHRDVGELYSERFRASASEARAPGPGTTRSRRLTSNVSGLVTVHRLSFQDALYHRHVTATTATKTKFSDDTGHVRHVPRGRYRHWTLGDSLNSNVGDAYPCP